MKTRIQILLCTAIVLAAVVTSARAETFYTDSASFATAAPGLTTINFNSFEPADPNGNTYVGDGVILGGVTFGRGPSGPDDVLFIIGSDAFGFGEPVFSAESQGSGVAPENDALITFATPQTSVGFDYIVSPVSSPSRYPMAQSSQ